MVKSRASRYRGVYRCGKKWKAQVSYINYQSICGKFDILMLLHRSK
jgi:hypothetical protein